MADKSNQSNHQRSREPRHTHAGGIVFRMSDGLPYYLLVTARKDQSQWVLPKGHLRPGESKEKAALREVREEAGYVAGIVAEIGSLHYRAKNESISVMFYLMQEKRRSRQNKSEGRRFKWYPLKEAKKVLVYKNTARLIQRAENIIKKLFSRNEPLWTSSRHNNKHRCKGNYLATKTPRHKKIFKTIKK